MLELFNYLYNTIEISLSVKLSLTLISWKDLKKSISLGPKINDDHKRKGKERLARVSHSMSLDTEVPKEIDIKILSVINFEPKT